MALFGRKYEWHFLAGNISETIVFLDPKCCEFRSFVLVLQFFSNIYLGHGFGHQFAFSVYSESAFWIKKGLRKVWSSSGEESNTQKKCSPLPGRVPLLK